VVRVTPAGGMRPTTPAVSLSDACRSDLASALAEIWQMSRASVRAELATIEQAVAAAVAGELPDDVRALAAGEAHKLAGSVGTFGFTAASERARQLERALSAGPVAPAQATRLIDAVRECHQEMFGTDDSF